MARRSRETVPSVEFTQATFRGRWSWSCLSVEVAIRDLAIFLGLSNVHNHILLNLGVVVPHNVVGVTHRFVSLRELFQVCGKRDLGLHAQQHVEHLNVLSLYLFFFFLASRNVQ